MPRRTILENMATVDRGAGLWNTAAPGRPRDELPRCQALQDLHRDHRHQGGHALCDRHAALLHKGKIIRVDSLVTNKGDWLFNANAYLKYLDQGGLVGPLYKYQQTAAQPR